MSHVVVSYTSDTVLPSMVVRIQLSTHSCLLFWLSRTGMISLLTSASRFTRSIGCRVLVCRAFGAYFALHPSNGLFPRKLEVWEWIVKRRIFVPFSNSPGFSST